MSPSSSITQLSAVHLAGSSHLRPHSRSSAALNRLIVELEASFKLPIESARAQMTRERVLRAERLANMKIWTAAREERLAKAAARVERTAQALAGCQRLLRADGAKSRAPLAASLGYHETTSSAYSQSDEDEEERELLPGCPSNSPARRAPKSETDEMAWNARVLGGSSKMLMLIEIEEGVRAAQSPNQRSRSPCDVEADDLSFEYADMSSVLVGSEERENPFLSESKGERCPTRAGWSIHAEAQEVSIFLNSNSVFIPDTPTPYYVYGSANEFSTEVCEAVRVAASDLTPAGSEVAYSTPVATRRYYAAMSESPCAGRR